MISIGRVASIVLVMFVVVLLSKASTGVRRMNSDTMQQAELFYQTMGRWQSESLASKNPLIAYTNAVHAQTYANVLRSMLDDSQARKLLGVSMLKTVQDMERLVNQKLRTLQTKCPAVGGPNIAVTAAAAAGGARPSRL